MFVRAFQHYLWAEFPTLNPSLAREICQLVCQYVVWLLIHIWKSCEELETLLLWRIKNVCALWGDTIVCNQWRRTKKCKDPIGAANGMLISSSFQSFPTKYLRMERVCFSTSIYELSNGKGYLGIYTYGVGFHKWRAKILQFNGCFVVWSHNAFSTFSYSLSVSKVSRIMA